VARPELCSACKAVGARSAVCRCHDGLYCHDLQAAYDAGTRDTKDALVPMLNEARAAADRDQGFWFWSDRDENDIATMSGGMRVSIIADTLRALLKSERDAGARDALAPVSVAAWDLLQALSRGEALREQAALGAVLEAIPPAKEAE